MSLPGTPVQRSTAPAFRRDVQGLRGFAVLLVVLFHAGLWVPGGFTGVDVFFVISGFVIGGRLRAELAETGTIDLADFFARRVRRILPALVVMTVTVLIAAVFVLDGGSELRSAVRTAAAASVWAANLFLFSQVDYFAPAAEANPFLHTWSLGVEEQFYLFFPALLVLVALVARRRGREPIVGARAAVGVVAGVSFTAGVAALLPAAELVLEEVRAFAFYAPVTRAWQFAVGVLVADLMVRRPRSVDVVVRHHGRTTAAAVGGLAAIVAGAVLLDGRTAFPGVAALLPTLGTAAVLVAGGAPVGRWLMENRAMVALGDVSYGWYLWHWPAIVLARAVAPDRPWVAPVAAVASLGVAVASYRLVERPLRRSSIVGRRALALAAACALVPVAGAVAIDRVSTARYPVPLDEVRFEAIAAYLEPGGCIAEPSDCGGVLPPRSDVVLIGDSHAWTLAPALDEAVTATGRTFGVSIEDGCSAVARIEDGADCDRWRGRMIAWLLDVRPDVVVVHGLTSEARARPSELAASAATDAAATPASARPPGLVVYEEGLTTLVRTLRGAGIGVVVVSAVPKFRAAVEHRGSLASVVAGTPPRLASTEMPVAEARLRTAAILEVERRLAAADVVVVDPLPLLCRAACRQIDDGEVLYVDDDHLSASGAARLAPSVVRAITSLSP